MSKALRPTQLVFKHGAYWPLGAPEVLPPLSELDLSYYEDLEGGRFCIAFVIKDAIELSKNTGFYPTYLPAFIT